MSFKGIFTFRAGLHYLYWSKRSFAILDFRRRYYNTGIRRIIFLKTKLSPDDDEITIKVGYI